MWWERRRLQRLEGEVATARAERQELQRRLEVFEAIAHAAGAELPEPTWWGAVVPKAPMPAGLLAASAGYVNPDSPVRLEVEGTEVIAIIGGPGDAREWWSAVWQLSAPGAAS